MTGALRIGMAVVCMLAVIGTGNISMAASKTGKSGKAGPSAAAASVNLVEKKTALESVKSDLEDGLGLTQEQRAKIRAVREEFKARQTAIKSALNIKNEALRQELDSDAPVRAKVEPIVAEIASLQGQLVDNRVDVVFKLREIYTPKQIKKLKERLQQQKKAAGARKKGSKGIKGSKGTKGSKALIKGK